FFGSLHGIKFDTFPVLKINWQIVSRTRHWIGKRRMKIPYKPEEPGSIRLLFTRIAKNYDLTNRVISLGFEKVWRKKFARLLEGRKKIADVCCGSGAMFPILGSRIFAGLDFTRAMLKVASKFPEARLVEGDAQKIPFQ